MAEYGWTYNGVDLKQTYGLHTPDLPDLDDSPMERWERMQLPGSPLGGAAFLGYEQRILSLVQAPVIGTDHFDLLELMDQLRAHLHPTPEDATRYALIPPDQRDRRWLARFMGVLSGREGLPFIRSHALLTIQFEVVPPWPEDLNETTATIEAAADSGTIWNTGRRPLLPIWTCTMTADQGSGFYFEAAGERFTYEGALVAGDVVTVSTRPVDVKLNGSRYLAGVSTDAKYPRLPLGKTTITKTTDFTLAATYRRALA